MKVAYLTNQYPKTSHTFIRQEIAGLEAAGLHVERFTIRAVGEPLIDERDVSELARTRVLLSRRALRSLPAAAAACLRRPRQTLGALRTALAMGRISSRGTVHHLAYLAEACVLRLWAQRSGVEHVHAHFATNPAAVALLCNELGGPPFSFTAHGTSDFSGAAASTLLTKIGKAVFVIAVCEDGRRRLGELAPAGQEHKIHVVGCGVEQLPQDATAAGISESPELVCVARLSPEKGLGVLLEAASVLADGGQAFDLYLLGDGPERGLLEAFVGDRRIGGHVHFEGWKSGAEVHARILASRALVLPSYSEGLPIVIMEAFALRRPVIATRVGGVAELVEEGTCGWLVPPGSVTALATAMREALTRSAAELDAMGRVGAARVAASHDAGVQARKLVRLLRASCDRRAPAPAAASPRAAQPRTSFRPRSCSLRTPLQ